MAAENARSHAVAIGTAVSVHSLGDQITVGPFLRAHPYFELGYITDHRGIQIIDNLTSRDGRVTADASGFNRDWSDRPWFRAALGENAACSTDVYRSTASGDFCFTIAAALRGEGGNVLGVFAWDVNFQRLVGE